jgi:hypothetical protein
MPRALRGDGEVENVARSSWLELDPLQRELGCHRLRARKESFLNLTHAPPQVSGAGDGQRTVPFRAEHGIHEQEGDTAAVVAMQMGEQDGIEGVVVKALLRQGDQGRGSKVDREPRLRTLYNNARLEPSPAAEGISGSDESNRHRHFKAFLI